MSILFLLLVGVLPFWVSITGAYPAFSLIYLLALSGMSGWMAIKAKSPFKISWPIIALGAWILFQTFHAQVWDHSTGILFNWFLAILLFYLAKRLSQEDATLFPKVAILIWVVASLVAALNPAWQTPIETLEESLKDAHMEESYKEAILHAALQQRFFFPFGNPIHLGLFLSLSLLSFPFLYSLTASQVRPLLWRVALIITGGVQLYILWGTRARTSLLALLAGAGLAVLLWKQLNLRVILGVLLVGILTVGTFIATPDGREMLSRVETLRARTIYWGIALQMIQDYPLLGLGVGGFGDYYTEYRPMTPHQTEFPHQIFLEVMTDWGPIGLVLFITVFLGILIRFGKESWKAILEGAPPIKGFVIWQCASFNAFLLASQVGFPHNKIYLIGLLAAILGIQIGTRDRQNAILSRFPATKSLGLALILVLTVLFASRELGHSHFETGRESLEETKDPREAYQRILKGGKVWPPLWESHYFAGRMAWDSGDRKQGMELVDQAIYWNPRTAFLRQDRAIFLWEAGKREDAFEGIQKAIELHPVKWEYHDRLSRWLHTTGNAQEAVQEKQIAQHLQTIEPDYGAEVQKIREQIKER